MKAFLKTLKEQDEIFIEFDEKIWSATLNYVEVKKAVDASVKNPLTHKLHSSY